ncbi:MAG: FAD-dependent oxidoreductase, partial [Candidatus Aenigmarchaeota archaeon]|nr:FAD-dependent oxidoreductase [Candidatus Aenigmarchaeota archaeon]
MEYDVVVIGGGPAGFVSAIMAKKLYKCNVLLIKKEEKFVIPCGIPYIFGTLQDVDKDCVPNKKLEDADVDVMIDEVLGIDVESKIVRTRLKDIRYEKLILATGSLPWKPPIPGSDKKNVFSVHKSYEKLKSMLEVLKNSQRIAIIGGGFIGVELADELIKSGKEVYLIEMLPHILQLYFDEEFYMPIENRMKEKGVKVYTSTKVTEIKGDEYAKSIVLSNGEEIPIDAVVIATGTKPNVEL